MAKFKPKESVDYEGWYLIPGYEGYLANEEGFILNIKTGNETLGGVSDRYRRVSVYPTGAKEPVLAYSHVLICSAFNGPKKDSLVVLHLDNDTLNNAKSNLEWGTQSKNIKQAYKDGNRATPALESYRSQDWV